MNDLPDIPRRDPVRVHHWGVSGDGDAVNAYVAWLAMEAAYLGVAIVFVLFATLVW